MYEAIKYLFPGIGDSEFALQDDGDGPYISRWDRPEPKPTSEQIAAATPIAQFALAAEAEMSAFRTLREMFLNRVAGIGFAALEAGDSVTVAASVQVRQGLLDLPDSAPVQAAIAAQDIAALHAAIKTQYAAVVGAVPDSAKAAFAKVDA